MSSLMGPDPGGQTDAVMDSSSCVTDLGAKRRLWTPREDELGSSPQLIGGPGVVEYLTLKRFCRWNN